MKARIFTEKLPELLDCALAVVISSVPGIAEADSRTKQLYQSITKELLAQELKAKGDFARRNVRKLTSKRSSAKLKVQQYLSILSITTALFVSACGSRKQNESESVNAQDTVAVADSAGQQLDASMRIKPVIRQTDSAILIFTVYNHTAKDLTFCKWHTPFEPPMSKYLDISDESGKESQYQGAMAKRVMPPPPDSYITVKAGDSISTTADLRKSYLLERPGSYRVKYNSEGISGLSVKDSISFEIK